MVDRRGRGVQQGRNTWRSRKRELEPAGRYPGGRVMRIPGVSLFRRARPSTAQSPSRVLQAASDASDDFSPQREAGPGVARDVLGVEHLLAERRHTLVLTGELCLDSVRTLEAAVGALWSQPARAITIDLRELLMIDSSGLWAITTVRKECAKRAIEFSLIPGRESVHSVFEVTGLSALLPFQSAGPDQPAGG